MVKDLSVTQIVPSKSTTEVGESVICKMTVERYPANGLYEGTLVVEVDGEKVGQKEITVGGAPQDYDVPVSFGSPAGNRRVCGTVTNISKIDDPIV